MQVDLVSIAATVRSLADEIRTEEERFQRRVIYRLAARGLFLKKARAVFALSPAQAGARNRGAEKAGEPVRLLSELEAEAGFQAWYRREFIEGKLASPAEEAAAFRSQFRNAQYHMNIATNAGLTIEHTMEDVQEMEQARRLHDKTARELRVSPNKKTEEKEPQEPPLDPVKDAITALFDAQERVLALRDETSAARFEAVHTDSKAFLEKYVDSELHYGSPPVSPSRRRMRKGAR